MTHTRPIGDRFIDPKRDGCDLCMYSMNFNTRNVCNPPERLAMTGTCVERERLDHSSVQFVKPNDYVVFKLTGEWP